MPHAKLLGFMTLAAALAVSATPAAAAVDQAPTGSGVGTTTARSFMDYTDDDCMAFSPTGAVTSRALATKSGGEVIGSDCY